MNRNLKEKIENNLIRAFWIGVMLSPLLFFLMIASLLFAFVFKTTYQTTLLFLKMILIDIAAMTAAFIGVIIVDQIKPITNSIIRWLNTLLSFLGVKKRR